METYFFCCVFSLALDVSVMISSGGRVCVSVAVSLALSVSVPSWLLVGCASAFAVMSAVFSICIVSSLPIVSVVSTPGRLVVMPTMSVVVS
jgi:hypothetical protein